MKIDDKRLAEIEARTKAATSGPWELELHDSYSVDTAYYAVHSLDGRAIFDACNSECMEIRSEHDEDGAHYWDETGRNNLTFAAHARTDVPDLLDDRRELTAENAKLRAMLKRLEWCDEQMWCPHCGNCEDGRGHASNCELAALLKGGAQGWTGAIANTSEDAQIEREKRKGGA